MKIVLDACTAAAWYRPDEPPDLEARATALEAEIHVPEIFPVEIENVLIVAERRGRINARDVDDVLVAIMESFDIHVETRRELFGSVSVLARSSGLSAYEAAYLELAARLHIPLATQDRKLSEAARTLSVTTLNSAGKRKR